jgi:hypothetical protein
MSVAFQYSEKRLAIILMTLTLFLLQLLYYSQDMYEENNYTRNSVIFFSYVIMTSWLLLFFIFPKFYMLHTLVAFFILLSTVYISYGVYRCYTEYYEEDGLRPLCYTAYASVSIFCAILVLGFINFTIYHKYNKTYRSLLTLFAILEILGIFAFSVFISVFANMPPLPHTSDFTCYQK